MRYAFGVDVGGTSVKLGLFDGDTLTEKFEIPTRTEDGGKQILPDIAQAIADCLMRHNISHDEVRGIGIGVPGPVSETGVVNRCVNLNWGVFNLHAALGDLTGLRVVGGNDANCAAMGEFWQCGGRGSAVFVTLGTGVGGGVIVNGRLLGGAHGSAGELGHITVAAKENFSCTCGKQNCIECYASASGIVRLAELYLGERMSCKDVFDRAREGDIAASELLDYVYDLLGQAIASACCVCDPARVILGGGVSRAGEPLLRGVAAAFERHKFHACAGTEFSLAVLGNDAGLYGAVQLLKGQNYDKSGTSCDVGAGAGACGRRGL